MLLTKKLQLTSFFSSPFKAFSLSVTIFFVIIALEFISILFLNSGKFIYTLDDPYIHLALAENISKGHYGVNLEEYSAPSSSIIWPFLLAPFSYSSIILFIPLIVNILSALGTIIVFWKIIRLTLNDSIIDEKTDDSYLIHTIFVILLIPATNMIGLVFIGMEHSLQVFSVTLIVLGLIYELKYKKVTWWLILFIIISPLIRYENLSISLPSICYLFFRQYRGFAVICTLILTALLAAFSIFLINLGLEPFPTSVLAKSTIIRTSGSLKSLLSNLKFSLNNSRGILLTFGFIIFTHISLSTLRKNGERILAGAIAAGLILHFLVGRYGWYNRYEIYIWSVSILSSIYLLRMKIRQYLKESQAKKSIFFIILSVLLFCNPYILSTLTTPIASNNIYEQQYQMHRFVTEYYLKPVAVTDLGWVSYRNNNYVLDLAGLASLKALKSHYERNNEDWMHKISKIHNVGLAILYKDYPSTIPKGWLKLGELHLGKLRITPAGSVVMFYVLDSAYYQEVYDLLKDFINTLPKGTRFEFSS